MPSLIILDRVAPKCCDFFVICRDSYENFQKSKKDIEKLRQKSPKKWGDLLGVAEEIRKYSANTIVFAGLCLEAFIYDYAARNLGDGFSKGYLDSLDAASKWVIIPRLVTGKDFRKTHAFELLRNLIKARNHLVHYKSKPTPKDEQELKRLIDKVRMRDEKNAENAWKAVVAVLEELRKIDGERGVVSRWWKFDE